MDAASIFGAILLFGVIFLIVWGREKLRERAAEEREKRESSTRQRSNLE